MKFKVKIADSGPFDESQLPALKEAGFELYRDGRLISESWEVELQNFEELIGYLRQAESMIPCDAYLDSLGIIQIDNYFMRGARIES